MKKVLIITYYFHQREDIAAVRLQGLTKYLTDYGWEPTILTIKSNRKINPQFKVIETNYEEIFTRWKKVLGFKIDESFKEQLGLSTSINKKTLIDYILDLLSEIFAYPDGQKRWYKYAIDTCDKLLIDQSFDAMISSSGPATSHLIARELKNKYRLPWIADLRDLWTQNNNYQYSRFRKVIERRLEIKTLSRADALITVSQPLAEKLKGLHKLKNIYTITNGFDPDEINKGTPLSNKFCITYTGVIYKGKQDPEPLFKALQELILENVVTSQDIVVDFYGNNNWLKRDIEKYDLQNVVNVHNLIPREEAIKKQREAQLLLLLTWNDPNEKGVYTGKIFDYLAARRPILSIGFSGGVAEDLLKETKAGTQASNVEAIKRIIKSAYSEYKLNGSVSYNGISPEIDKYSQKEMARKFAEVLNSSIKK